MGRHIIQQKETSIFSIVFLVSLLLPKCDFVHCTDDEGDLVIVNTKDQIHVIQEDNGYIIWYEDTNETTTVTRIN